MLKICPIKHFLSTFLLFYFVVLCANVGRKNNDIRLTNAEQHDLVEMEATQSKKISVWMVIGVESVSGAGTLIANDIGERCPIDNVVVNVPETLFLDMFRCVKEFMVTTRLNATRTD